jgi:trehalose synthase-fused probable maltokinase
MIAVHYAGHAPDRYIVPLAYGAREGFDHESGVVALDDASGVLGDAVFSAQFRASLLELIASGSTMGFDEKAVVGRGSKYLAGIPREFLAESKILAVEQSNTAVIYSGRLFLKLFRRLDAGINPDAEISRFLSERQGFAYVPPYAGELSARLGGDIYPLGLMLGCVENRGDAWSWALARLAEFYAGGDTDETMRRIGQLGRHTAEMHCALASGVDEPAFSPEPLTRADFDKLAASVTARLDALIPTLGSRETAGDTLAGEVLLQEAPIRGSIARLRAVPAGAAKTRHHGDYHLGQVLDTGSDWMIIDFEGEPTRSLAERREKRSPLRDVAGMLRSFHYAAHAACPEGDSDARKRAEGWTDAASDAFLESYLESSKGAVFLPAEPADQISLLRAYVLEKALYEVDYELNNRPAWLPIPLRGLLRAIRD